MEFNMTTLKELTERRAALDAEIEKLQSTARSAAIAQVKELMTQFGLDASDITSAGGAKAKRKSGAVAPKYRDVRTGETWSGRGLQPKWLKAAIADGASLDDYKI